MPLENPHENLSVRILFLALINKIRKYSVFISVCLCWQEHNIESAGEDPTFQSESSVDILFDMPKRIIDTVIIDCSTMGYVDYMGVDTLGQVSSSIGQMFDDDYIHLTIGIIFSNIINKILVVR